MTADPQAPVTLEERIAAHEAAGVMQLSALSEADSAKLSKALVFARRREVALTQEMKSMQASLDVLQRANAAMIEEVDKRAPVLAAFRLDEARAENTRLESEVKRLHGALTALVKATADPHSASGREYGEAVAVLASITLAQTEPVCRACGRSGAPPDGCGLTPDGLCKYCFLACAQPEPATKLEPVTQAGKTRPVLYAWDHQCEVCLRVHVPNPCCAGCSCLSGKPVDAASTQVCQGCGKKVPPGVVHVRIGTSASECQVQNK